MLAIAPLWLMLAAANTQVQAQTYTILKTFWGPYPIPANIPGVFTQNRDGSLYTTSVSFENAELVYAVTPDGSINVFVPIPFGDTDSFSSLTLGTDGFLYGASYGEGTIYRMNGGGSVTVLSTSPKGYQPSAAPIQGFDGNFYGILSQGTNARDSNEFNGGLYKITSAGVFTLLHSFNVVADNCPFWGLDEGQYVCPNGELVQGADGYLYGTTFVGGDHDLGTIFRASYSGEFSTLFSFDGTHGSYPLGALVEGNDGYFYGTATSGGTGNGGGVVFKVSPTGAYTVLHDFTGGADGSTPIAGLTMAADGNLFGTAVNNGALDGGVLFRISPGEVFTVLRF